MITLLRREFMVDLPLEKAWQQLARVERWPSWAHHIKHVQVERSWPVTASQTLTVLSLHALASVRPVGLNETPLRESECGSERTSSPELVSQSLTVRSPLALAKMKLLGSKDKQFTCISCPVSERINLPEETLQTLTIESQLALAIVSPEG
jgi:hypothetical protein